jgi:hypothetical protein
MIKMLKEEKERKKDLIVRDLKKVNVLQKPKDPPKKK